MNMPYKKNPNQMNHQNHLNKNGPNQNSNMPGCSMKPKLNDKNDDGDKPKRKRTKTNFFRKCQTKL